MESLMNNNATWAQMSAAPLVRNPHFSYVEIFESGSVFHGISAGRGKFLEFSAVWPIPTLSFTVEKNRRLKTISIDVHSAALQQHLCRAVLASSSTTDVLLLQFDDILKHYDSLKAFLELLEDQSPTALPTLEMRLLVRDLLLDRSVFDGIGLESFRGRNIICLSHLHDIHQRSRDAGLDEIDDCFALGLVPDNIGDEYLVELNARYSDLALSGDYVGLFNLCEPIVRSGDIELQYNPSLLLQVLDKGRLDIFRYLLDLVCRTREDAARIPGSQLPDVTYDPLHVAIRLGHLGRVQSLLEDGSTFEGHFSDETVVGRHHQVLTPISAAVFWRKPDIVKFILSRAAFERAELEKAVAIALSNDFADIIKVFLESGTLPSLDLPSLQLLEYRLDGSADSESNPERLEGSVATPAPASGPYQLANAARSDLFDSQGRMDESDSQPRAMTRTAPYVRRKGLRFQRQQLGRNLITTLKTACSRIRSLCRGSPRGSAMSEIGNQYRSVGVVWERGMDAIRCIMQNQPPDELVSVLDCLLVASSMCSALYDSHETIYLQFVNDLGRWRTVLGPTDRRLFDDLAFALWAYTDVMDAEQPLERTESLYRFQELVQQLVCLERNASPASRGARGPGTRLDVIQKEIVQQAGQPELSDSSPIASPIEITSNHTDALRIPSRQLEDHGMDGLSFADMLHLELFEDGPTEQGANSIHSDQSFDWKNILPITVLLLASAAFSIVLTMVIGVFVNLTEKMTLTAAVLHVGALDSPASIIEQSVPGYARSNAILEEYLDLVHGRSARFRGSVPSSRQSSFADPAQSFGSYVSTLSQRYGEFSTPPSGFSSLSPSELTLGLPSSLPPGSQPHPPSSPETLRSGARLGCLSPHCPKKFSNVSNRNKHMREGCAYREKKGYRCRNPSCSKVLTTKWYRDTHERDRCRFR